MFGPFRASSPLSSGLLWKIPWRLSAPQKRRQRKRLRMVDNVVSVLDTALARQAASKAALSTTSTSTPPSSPVTSHDLNSESTTTNPSSSFDYATPATPTPSSSTPIPPQLLARNISAQQQDRGRSIYSTNTTGQGLLKYKGLGALKALERWKAEMPTEAEMLPRDKYTMFDRKERKYRKGVHKLPKWTRVSQRVNPPGY